MTPARIGGFLACRLLALPNPHRWRASASSMPAASASTFILSRRASRSTHPSRETPIGDFDADAVSASHGAAIRRAGRRDAAVSRGRLRARSRPTGRTTSQSFAASSAQLTALYIDSVLPIRRFEILRRDRAIRRSHRWPTVWRAGRCEHAFGVSAVPLVFDSLGQRAATRVSHRSAP